MASEAESLCVGHAAAMPGYEVWVRRVFKPHGYSAIARLLVAYDWQTNFHERFRTMRRLIRASREIADLPPLLGIVRDQRRIEDMA